MQKSAGGSLKDYLRLFRTRSYLINCIAQTLMTFVTGGLGYWVSAYLDFRNQSPALGRTIFGLILVVAGLVSTLLGGVIADKLRPRFAGSYFWVSGIGMLIACPIFIATLYIPFPAAWIAMFFAIFFLFLNTGPSNTALANVSLPAVRATAFGRCAGFLVNWLHRRSHQHACSVSVCVRNNFCLRPGLAHRCEISSGRHGCHRGGREVTKSSRRKLKENRTSLDGLARFHKPFEF